jgi:hypothetical protein
MLGYRRKGQVKIELLFPTGLVNEEDINNAVGAIIKKDEIRLLENK